MPWSIGRDRQAGARVLSEWPTRLLQCAALDQFCGWRHGELRLGGYGLAHVYPLGGVMGFKTEVLDMVPGEEEQLGDGSSRS